MLYNQLDDGAWADLRSLHRQLDESVAVAYGWPREVAHDATFANARLIELSREIAEGRRPYQRFGRPAPDSQAPSNLQAWPPSGR